MNIKVTKNKVTIKEMDPIHSGEFKVNTCDFEFTEQYTNDLVIKAIFTKLKDNTSYEVTIEDNSCDIPVEVIDELGVIEIGVYAYQVENEDLILRYSPSPARFKVIKGSYKNADEGTIFLPADEFATKDDLNNAVENIDNEFLNYYTKTEIDNMIGDIDSALDEINGEVIS